MNHMADDNSPGERALDLLERLVTRYSWYPSAIEVNDYGNWGFCRPTA